MTSKMKSTRSLLIRIAAMLACLSSSLSVENSYIPNTKGIGFTTRTGSIFGNIKGGGGVIPKSLKK
jgi:hypothetical protein